MPLDAARLQEALDRTARDHGPGVVGLVTEPGGTVFEAAAGVADPADPRPLTPDDQLRIGSITKTYVTALVLQLLREGVFGSQDTVERRLPGLVPGGDEITVELLLRMRSGLPDYVPIMLGDPPDLATQARYRRPEELVRIGLTGADRRRPGSGYRYCNTDYVLLGLIVERATGQRVDALLWERIFAPLGLEWTTFPVADGRLRGPHAPGFLRTAAGAPYRRLPVLSPSAAWTSGAMVSTLRELATFFDALLDGRVVGRADLDAMTARTEPLGGGAWRGLGLVRYERADGTVAFGHHGGVPGYTTIAVRTAGGRCVALGQNGTDLHAVLDSSTPFVVTALGGA
jgi:D-alanyl-D-alanine carboxypeptidase